MKRGYVIAKNALTTDFFTSASAYDRPKWLPLAEATVYPTAELADNAAKKLYKNGSYSAKIVSLQEMQLEIEPMDGDELPPEDEMTLGGEGNDIGAEGEGDDEDEMVAGEQQEVCPDCEHDPCTCPGGEDDDEFGDDLGDDEFDFGFDDELGDETLGGEDELEFDGEPEDDLDGDGELDNELEQEADPRFDERRMGMAQRSPAGGPRMESASIVKDPAQKVEDNDSFVKGDEEKVRVPANVISDLKSKIAELDREAEFNKTDDARASFCMTASSAMKDVLELLQKGTSESVKMANVRMSSFMSPITSKIPASVVKFVYSGGVKPSLKDLFNAKRDERK